MNFQDLHQKALICVKNIRRSEYELLEILIAVDKNRYFRERYSSLFRYCVDASLKSI